MSFRTFIAMLVPALLAGEWSAPVHVLHEMQPCVTYHAKVDGEHLVIEASIQPGWHTFTIDNEKRAAERLAGKPSLGIDQPTQIKVEGLELAGPWMELPPKDFSKPTLRWFSFGYEERALFAVKVKPASAKAAQISVRGQACTDSTCKNIDLTLTASTNPDKASVDISKLIPVRQ